MATISSMRLLLTWFAVVAFTEAERCETLQENYKSPSESPQQALYKIIQNLQYEGKLRPIITLGHATSIEINLVIRNVNNIDDIKMQFTAQLSLRQIWFDPRLRFNSTPDTDFVILDKDTGDKIWTPDLYFQNEIESSVHSIMKTNSFKRVYPSGKVIWSTRLTVTSACPMDLRFFPFDRQICSIKLSSFTEKKTAVILQWSPIESVVTVGNLNFPKFTLMNYITGTCQDLFGKGEFSCLCIDFILERQIGFYITQVYLPCTFMVVLSWVSFWLGTAFSSRLSLTVTLLLTLSTQIQSLNQNTPQVSYIRAVDNFTGVCMAFGSFAVLQAATVAFVYQMEKDNITQNWVDTPNTAKSKVLKKKHLPLSVKLDLWSRWVFPVCFALFTAIHAFAYSKLKQQSISNESHFE